MRLRRENTRFTDAFEICTNTTRRTAICKNANRRRPAPDRQSTNAKYGDTLPTGFDLWMVESQEDQQNVIASNRQGVTMLRVERCDGRSKER